MTPTAALEAGCSIIPTGRDKRPIIPTWKPFQSRLPTDAEFRAWSEKKPAGWAIVTGAISHRITLDFDGAPGCQTLELLGLKPHRRTPSGGFHADFRHPNWHVPTLNSKSKRELGERWPGLDIRADGGYVVFTGRTDRGAYEWLRDPEPYELAILPSDLLEFLGLLKPPAAAPAPRPNGKPHTMPASGRVDGEKLVRMALDRVGSEGRNNAGLWLACQCRDNAYSIGDAESAMRNYRSRCPGVNTKGARELYTEREMQLSLKEAYSRPARDPWEKRTAQKEPVMAKADAVQAVSTPSYHSLDEQPEPPDFSEEPDRPPQPPGKPLETIDALTIWRRDYADPVFVVDGLLMRGVTFCAGRPKIGKSWLMLQIALAVARGTLALGKFKVKRPGRILYCGLEESPRRTGNRLKKFITAEEPYLQNIQMVYRLKPLLAGGAAELDGYLTANPCELVIIDTFLAVLQASGKRDVLRSDYAEVKILTELAEKHETAILVVHHLRKMGAEYALDAVVGTTGLTAGCDAIWALTRTPEGTCKLSIQGRDMANPEFELKFDGQEQTETKGLTGVHTVTFGWRILAEGNEIGMSQERKDILLLIEQEGRLKPHEIARLLGNRNVITVRRLLQKMVADDLVSKDGAGRYGFSVASRARA